MILTFSPEYRRCNIISACIKFCIRISNYIPIYQCMRTSSYIPSLLHSVSDTSIYESLSPSFSLYLLYLASSPSSLSLSSQLMILLIYLHYVPERLLLLLESVVIMTAGTCYSYSSSVICIAIVASLPAVAMPYYATLYIR